MGWLRNKYPHVFDDTLFSNKKYPGRRTCNPGFILAYLEARDKANELGETVSIKGFGGWAVSATEDVG
ncbi:MAG TPA: hypothetical protein VEP90_00470 [Methylomirabilota bacterium]|nr:hypothetical protein [Methylomirabilota bacterium]